VCGVPPPYREGMTEVERTGVRALIAGWRSVPALLRDRHLTVVAANPLARALSPSFAEGMNLARSTFLDAASYAEEHCWSDAAGQVAALLRDSLDQHEEDAPFRSLVGELSAKSSDFSRVWATETRPTRTGTATFIDTAAGDITLRYRDLMIDETHDDVLMVWHGEGPEATGRLERLAALTDPARYRR
jgi:MmyB-like transcription regulator ligand binding domain